MGASNKKRDELILQQYGQVKTDAFDFERIASFYSSKDSSDGHQTVSDSTWDDLDFDEVFMYVDRTCSTVGQQYLYDKLRTVPTDGRRAIRLEKIIAFFDEKPSVSPSVILALSRLNKSAAYFLKSLFLGAHLPKPRWFWVIPVLSCLGVVTSVLSFLFPVFLFLLMPLLAVNFIVHYWNKNNVMQYSNAIPQLLILNRVAKTILHLNVPMDTRDALKEAITSIESIGKKAFIFKEAQASSELGQLVYYLLEIIKALFLVEPLLLFNMVEALEHKKLAIRTMFCAVGEVDVALSVDAFRKSLPYFALPVLTNRQKSFYGKDLYHPLLTNPISNTIDLTDGKSVLISGSNMSGKTTFIRTVGINAILAQTINTALAKELIIPKVSVHSAIRIADNLLDDKSYYLEEVLAIKKMTRESETDTQNLFLLDELFKGTNTLERVSMAKAVLSYLNRQENLVFAATHDLELTEYLRESFQYFHFTETVEDSALSFDYTLKEGKLTHTNAIRILEINDYPTKVVEEARAIAGQHENNREHTEGH